MHKIPNGAIKSIDHDCNLQKAAKELKFGDR